jgi:hypothetical protein
LNAIIFASGIGVADFTAKPALFQEIGCLFAIFTYLRKFGLLFSQ